MSAPFADQLLGWKKLSSGKLVPNSADSDSDTSMAIAQAMLEHLGVKQKIREGLPPNMGPTLENAVHVDLAESLPNLDPARHWEVSHSKVVAAFSQYEHLHTVSQRVDQYPELRTELGRDYLIRPDVTVGVKNSGTGALGADTEQFLHAAVSCKWTIRSDRVQNVRHEFLQMIRHRRGRLPHLVALTAEPLPSRIAAIARGTGEVDAVYHVAFDALDAAVSAVGTTQQKNDWEECVGQRRVLPYEELAPTLVTW